MSKTSPERRQRELLPSRIRHEGRTGRQTAPAPSTPRAGREHGGESLFQLRRNFQTDTPQRKREHSLYMNRQRVPFTSARKFLTLPTFSDRPPKEQLRKYEKEAFFSVINMVVGEIKRNSIVFRVFMILCKYMQIILTQTDLHSKIYIYT